MGQTVRGRLIAAAAAAADAWHGQGDAFAATLVLALAFLALAVCSGLIGVAGAPFEIVRGAVATGVSVGP